MQDRMYWKPHILTDNIYTYQYYGVKLHYKHCILLYKIIMTNFQSRYYK